MEALLRELLAGARALHQAYVDYLPLLRPLLLREKLQPGVGESWKEIEALEGALQRRGMAPDRTLPSPREIPKKAGSHALLDLFFQTEEWLYYRYRDGLKEIDEREEGPLRALLQSHLNDHKRRISVIQYLYADFLYY